MQEISMNMVFIIMTFAALAGAPAAIYRLFNKSSTPKMKRIAVGALVMPFLTCQAFSLGSEIAFGDVLMSLIGVVPVLWMLGFSVVLLLRCIFPSDDDRRL